MDPVAFLKESKAFVRALRGAHLMGGSPLSVIEHCQGHNGTLHDMAKRLCTLPNGEKYLVMLKSQETMLDYVDFDQLNHQEGNTPGVQNFINQNISEYRPIHKDPTLPPAREIIQQINSNRTPSGVLREVQEQFPSLSYECQALIVEELAVLLRNSLNHSLVSTIEFLFPEGLPLTTLSMIRAELFDDLLRWKKLTTTAPFILMIARMLAHSPGLPISAPFAQLIDLPFSLEQANDILELAIHLNIIPIIWKMWQRGARKPLPCRIDNMIENTCTDTGSVGLGIDFLVESNYLKRWRQHSPQDIRDDMPQIDFDGLF